MRCLQDMSDSQLDEIVFEVWKGLNFEEKKYLLSWLSNSGDLKKKIEKIAERVKRK